MAVTFPVLCHARPRRRSRGPHRAGRQPDRDRHRGSSHIGTLRGEHQMTSSHDRHSLSNIELIVLARLSSSKGATEDELGAAIAELAPPDEPPMARDYATAAL